MIGNELKLLMNKKKESYRLEVRKNNLNKQFNKKRERLTEM